MRDSEKYQLGFKHLNFEEKNTVPCPLTSSIHTKGQASVMQCSPCWVELGLLEVGMSVGFLSGPPAQRGWL